MLPRPIDARGRMLLLMGAFFLLLLLSACQEEALSGSPTTDVREYIATPFRAFASEHRALLGAPVSVPLRDSDMSRMVQYFDNARLEYDEARDAVVLTPLGAWAREAAPQRTPAAPLGIAEAFDRFYAVHGGEALLGEALGSVLLEDERWVQYYANVRLDWDPALPAGRRVQPAPLGQAHHTSRGVFLAAAVEDSTGLSDNAKLTVVDVAAYGTLPVVYDGETQTLVVVVSDITDGRLDDIAIDATLNWGAESQPLPPARTDQDGLVRQTLDLSAVPPGSWVVVTVTASFGGRNLGETEFRFQTWW